MLFIGLFVYWPLVRIVEISLFDWNLVGPRGAFVGLEHYRDFLFDRDFLTLLWQSLLYLVLALLGNFLVPIALALLTLQVGEREADLYQTLLFTPTVVAVSIGTLIWLWLYLPSGGLINEALALTGLDGASWLNDRATALPAVALVATWKFFGFNYLIALAGFKAIPRVYLDAARIDGAHGVTLLRHILFPLFAPTALFVFLSSLVNALDYAFVPVEILTNGGPADATNNLMYTVYEQSFQSFRAGRGAAEAVVLVLAFSIFILVQFRLFERSVRYER